VKKRLAVAVVSFALVALWPVSTSQAAGGTVLNYSIKEALAYGYRLSVSKEAINASQTSGPPCTHYEQSDPPVSRGDSSKNIPDSDPGDPQPGETYYGCKQGTNLNYTDPDGTHKPFGDGIPQNRSLYQHFSNGPNVPADKHPCPWKTSINSPLWIGATATVSDPAVVTPFDSGGAGEQRPSGGGSAPQASPVKVNELYSHAQLSHSSDILGAGGRASDTWVDLSGRYNPDAHVESDPFAAVPVPYEERCYSGRKNTSSNPDPRVSLVKNNPIEPSNFIHVASLSKQSSDAFSLAECRGGSTCGQSGSTQGRPSADNVKSSVHLYEKGGRVYGYLSAFVSQLSDGSGAFAAQSVATTVSFETDGTKGGLKWKVATKVTGASLGPGGPVNLDSVTGNSGNQIMGSGGFFFGVAKPYVNAASDGSTLTIQAPGLFYGYDDGSGTGQVTYYGGAELYAASIGLVNTTTGLPVYEPPSTTTNASDSFYTVTTPPVFPTLGNPALSVPIANAAPTAYTRQIPKATYAVREVAASPWPAATILGLAFLGALALLSQWLKRFEWVKRLYHFQPFASFDWMYRAFVRT
jgi:hypothetical protein